MAAAELESLVVAEPLVERLVGVVDDRPLSPGSTGRRAPCLPAGADRPGRRARTRTRGRSCVSSKPRSSGTTRPSGRRLAGCSPNADESLRTDYRPGSFLAGWRRSSAGPGDRRTRLAARRRAARHGRGARRRGQDLTGDRGRAPGWRPAPSRPRVVLIELAAVPRGGDVVGAVGAAFAVGDGDLRATNGSPTDIDGSSTPSATARRCWSSTTASTSSSMRRGFASTVLRQCDSVRVLATSREPLAVAGERIWAIPPLTPDESVELLEARAASAGAGARPHCLVETGGDTPARTTRWPAPGHRALCRQSAVDEPCRPGRAAR